jgi:20S proteasome subunit beta 3
MNLYKLREDREMKPKVFSALLTSILYEKRFGPYFTEPVVAGLDDNDEPFLSAMDLIGAPVSTKDFVVSGTCTPNLYGMCETMYRPDMSPDELFETISQCLLASCDRDALSGWGAVVTIITPDGITTRKLKGRMD